MSGIGKPNSQKSTLTTTMKVLSSTTHSVQLQSTLSNIKGNAPELEALKTFKMTSTISPLYKIISAKSSGGGATGTQIAKGMEMAMKMSPSFPSKPIRVNDTWSMSVDLSEMFTALGLGGVKMVGKSTLNIKITMAKIEKKGPKTLAHLRMTGTDKLTMEASKQRIGVDFTLAGMLVVDAATGMYVSSETAIIETVKGPTGNILIKMTSKTKLAKGP